MSSEGPVHANAISKGHGQRSRSQHAAGDGGANESSLRKDGCPLELEQLVKGQQDRFEAVIGMSKRFGSEIYGDESLTRGVRRWGYSVQGRKGRVQLSWRCVTNPKCTMLPWIQYVQHSVMIKKPVLCNNVQSVNCLLMLYKAVQC